MPKTKQVKRLMTPAERAEQQKQRRIDQKARSIQRELDKQTIRAKLPELVEGMFEVDTDDIQKGDLYVEYIEEWAGRDAMTVKLLVRTYESQIDLATIRALSAVTDKLGLTFSMQADGDRDFIALRVTVPEGELSAEAIEQATQFVTERQALEDRDD